MSAGTSANIRAGEFRPPRLWPALAEIGLSVADLARRKAYVGGSDANLIMSGDDEKLLALWRDKRGEGEEEDGSGPGDGHGQLDRGP